MKLMTIFVVCAVAMSLLLLTTGCAKQQSPGLGTEIEIDETPANPDTGIVTTVPVDTGDIATETAVLPDIPDDIIGISPDTGVVSDVAASTDDIV